MQTITLVENKLWLEREDTNAAGIWQLAGDIESAKYVYENNEIKSLTLNDEFSIECGKFKLGNSMLSSIEENGTIIQLTFG